MESLNPKLRNSAIAYPPGYFTYTQKGCCGGQAPNFFSSYPDGVQVGKGRQSLTGIKKPVVD
jgi:hypothetical protein